MDFGKIKDLGYFPEIEVIQQRRSDDERDGVTRTCNNDGKKEWKTNGS